MFDIYVRFITAVIFFILVTLTLIFIYWIVGEIMEDTRRENNEF